MVHKKSTYKLTYRNYAPQVRKRVWQENNSIRLRRREEERSHHSIEESDSDCVCDDSDEDEESVEKSFISGPRIRLARPKEQVQKHGGHLGQPPDPPPHVPRLCFSPEHSPRVSEQQNTSDCMEERAGREGLMEQQESGRNGVADYNETHDVGEQEGAAVSVDRVRPAEHRLGVMRPASHTREYDLIPAMSEGKHASRRRAVSAKTRVAKSQRVPLTSQLTRTTRNNFQHRGLTTYVPCGTGTSVRQIGDKTSFNVHLNKEQVRPTALRASSFRNREIENLIKKQNDLKLDDWREKADTTQPINHSSLWDDGRRQIFSSRKQPREKLKASSRVEVFSNYCKHCGGRK